MKKKNEELVMDLYSLMKRINIDEFRYLTNLEKYNGDYQNCYITFIENFNDNIKSETYRPFKKVILEICDRQSNLSNDLIRIIRERLFNFNDLTSYTFILDMLDAIIFEKNEGYCLEELEFLKK